MTRQQREDLNYMSGKLSVLTVMADNREISSILSDVLAMIINMLNDDEVTE